MFLHLPEWIVPLFWIWVFFIVLLYLFLPPSNAYYFRDLIPSTVIAGFSHLTLIKQLQSETCQGSHRHCASIGKQALSPTQYLYLHTPQLEKNYSWSGRLILMDCPEALYLLIYLPLSFARFSCMIYFSQRSKRTYTANADLSCKVFVNTLTSILLTGSFQFGTSPKGWLHKHSE